MGIADAAELKKALLEALSSGKELHLDLEHTTELGITSLQLLWAAEREARLSGIALTLSGQVPKEVLSAWSEAGLEEFSLG
jgi:16S rRNA U1498 N3-methylase RsmE